MSLAEAARSRAKRPGKACSVCRCLNEYPPELAAELAEALADRRVSARSLLEELRDAGVSPLPAYQQIGHHRRNADGTHL